MRVAPAFHEVMVPSSVLLMIASSDEVTMAASRAARISASLRSVALTSTLIAPSNRPDSSRNGVGYGIKGTRVPSGLSAMAS